MFKMLNESENLFSIKLVYKDDVLIESGVEYMDKR